MASLFLISNSCTQKDKASGDLEVLFSEVIEIHDDVMPKMGELNYLKRTLENTLVDKSLAEDEASQVKTAIADLEKADEDMMVWMAEFKKPGKDVEFETASAYLESEKVKITKVKTDTERIIEIAEQMVEKYK